MSAAVYQVRLHEESEHMYGLIGYIHGHADEVIQFLKALSYEKAQGVYQHPSSKLIFLDDSIERGPKIRQVLEPVHP